MADDERDVIDLANETIGLYHDGRSELVPTRTRIDGFTVGAPSMTRNAPHAGEVHPDGDELLFLVSGRVTVVLEDDEPPREVELGPGEAVIVPRGVWHRVVLREPSQIVHVTPGPRGAHRPLPAGEPA